MRVSENATSEREYPEGRPYIVAVGEMFDGINFFGPFDTFDDAADWADRNASTGWWVLSLESPEV